MEPLRGQPQAPSPHQVHELGLYESAQPSTGYHSPGTTLPAYPTSFQDGGAKPAKHHVFRYWRLELVSLVLAAGLIAAILGILARFNGDIVPRWPVGINLNTLIALLATILRAALMVVVSEILGQAKWSWFSGKPRSLMGLQRFDDASRSFLGSARLLGSIFTHGYHVAALLAWLAALVHILSFAIGPFAQQAIRSVPCTRVLPDAEARFFAAHYVPGRSNYYRTAPGRWSLDTDMRGAMLMGLTNPHGNDSKVPFSCPTGNCTFDDHGTGVTHSSIGMCSKCTDVTQFATMNQTMYGNGNITLPNNMTINTDNDAYWLVMQATDASFAAATFTPEFAQIARNGIVNVTIMTVSGAPCSNATGKWTCPRIKRVSGHNKILDYVATSCALYPCLRDYNATVENGILQERVVSTVPAVPQYIPIFNSTSAQYWTQRKDAPWRALRQPCVLNGT